MGNDILIINLPAPEHEGCVFVANGQDGDDTIDASGSTLQMIIFGDGGSDELRGGQSEDVLIGDYGLVTWIDENGIEVARSGGGGYGDFTDGIVRSIFKVEVAYPRKEINYHDSGNDILYGNDSRDVMFGGGGDFGEWWESVRVPK